MRFACMWLATRPYREGGIQSAIALPHTTLLNVRVPFFGILNVCNMGGKKKITTPLFFCIFLFSFFLFSWHWFWIVKKKRESHPNSYYIFFLFIEFIFFSFKKFPSFSTNLYGLRKKKKKKKEEINTRETKIGISTKGNFIRRTKIIQRRQSDFNIPFREHAPLQLRPLRIKYQPPSPNKMPTTFQFYRRYIEISLESRPRQIDIFFFFFFFIFFFSNELQTREQGSIFLPQKWADRIIFPPSISDEHGLKTRSAVVSSHWSIIIFNSWKKKNRIFRRREEELNFRNLITRVLLFFT